MSHDDIRRVALNCLTRRDYSQKELLQKLARQYPIDDIRQVLATLTEVGLINEKRYTENYINYRRQKGYGPERITRELEMRGIPAEMIAEELKITDNAWQQALERLWQKHFKGQQPTNFKTKAKQMRFLYYRGFTQEQIEELLVSL